MKESKSRRVSKYNVYLQSTVVGENDTSKNSKMKETKI